MAKARNATYAHVRRECLAAIIWILIRAARAFGIEPQHDSYCVKRNVRVAFFQSIYHPGEVLVELIKVWGRNVEQ